MIVNGKDPLDKGTNPGIWFHADMPWIRTKYSRNAVDNAGETLINESVAPDELEQALTVINNWRSSHAFPLQSLYMTLRTRARSIYGSPYTAQRLKRLRSIDAKLKRFTNMGLSRMNDIGGCRAVMPSVRQVDRLIQRYEQSVAKNPHRGNAFVKKYDYIKHPKNDGYRCVHLVYKYRSIAEDRKIYNKLRIEIQLRSRLQHLWATAVETVDAFTGQALKSNIGEESWKQFFSLMGSVIANKEKRPLVPGTPTNESEMKQELRTLYQADMRTSFLGMGKVVERLTEGVSKATIFLLILDIKERKIRVRGYKENERVEASEKYLETEKQYKDRPEAQVVLVSVASLRALKRAYPNYYLDLGGFLKEVKEATSG